MRYLAASIVVAAAASAHADVLSVAQELNVSRLTLQELAPVQARDGDAVMLSVELDGRMVVLDLAPRSYRSDDFKLVLAVGPNEQIEVDAPAPRTFRGTIAGDPASVVGGSIVDGEANLMIVSDEGTWTVQPAEGEDAGVHAVYNERDVLPHEGVCILEDPAGMGGLGNFDGFEGVRPRFAMRGEPTEGQFRVAEIAIDADYQLYTTYFGQNQTNLLNDVDSIIAGISTVYERDVLLTYELTQVIIRTTLASNPYTTNNASALLGQVQAEWNTNQSGVQRDVAHMWTGRNMSGSTIGIAYLGTICTGSGYGVDQIRFTSNFNSRVGLFSHELGHNWNAPHCDGLGECRIMCSGLGGCNGLGNPVRFAPLSIGTINSFITTRDCIDQVGVNLPIFENFEDQTLEPPAWNGSVGFNFVFDNGAPSGFVAGEFDPPFSSIATGQIDIAASPGNTVAVSMFLEEQSAGDGEIRVNINLNGSSRRAAIVRTGEPSDGYVEYAFQLPGSALGTTTPVTFSPTSASPNIRVDDIEIAEVSSTNATIALPFAEDFERAALFLDSWQPSMGDVDDDDAATGTYSLALDTGHRLETADALAGGATDIVYGALVKAPAGAAGNAELVIEYRNSSGTWVEVDRFSAASVGSADFGLVEVILPAGAAHNDLSVAMEIVGGASPSAWRIDDLELGDEPRGTHDDCPADLAEPFGVLDLADIGAFTAAFLAGDPAADLAEPFGILDLGDVQAFTTSFVAGCP